MTTTNDTHVLPLTSLPLRRLAHLGAGILLTALTSASTAETTAPVAPAMSAPSTTQPASATAPAAPTSSPVLAARLQSLYPATHFGAVNATPWPGVYEVVMGANLAYVDESGQFFLFGHLYDMKAQRDVTAEHKETLARVDFEALPFNDALKEVRGTGARVLAIFSDPDCPYCRQLESDLKTLTDVTLYTFLMPIASLHPNAREKAVAVWCAKDRIAAWHATMWDGATLPHAECANPVDRTIALGERLGISGTPTLIAKDGRILPGAASKAQLEVWLVHSTASAESAADVKAVPR